MAVHSGGLVQTHWGIYSPQDISGFVPQRKRNQSTFSDGLLCIWSHCNALGLEWCVMPQCVHLDRSSKSWCFSEQFSVCGASRDTEELWNKTVHSMCEDQLERFRTPRKYSKLFIGPNMRGNCMYEEQLECKGGWEPIPAFNFAISRRTDLRHKAEWVMSIKAEQTDGYGVSKEATPEKTHFNGILKCVLLIIWE